MTQKTANCSGNPELRMFCLTAKHIYNEKIIIRAIDNLSFMLTSHYQ